MVNDNILQRELERNNIKYTKVDNSYTIDIAGSTLILKLYSLDKESILSMDWFEREPSERSVIFQFSIDNSTYDNTIDMIFAFIALVKSGELEIENETLRDELNNIIHHFNVYNINKFEVEGINPNVQELDMDEETQKDNIGYYENPLTRAEILSAMEKAIDDKDKESYSKYQKMLSSVKENTSFVYLKSFKNFK